MLASVPNPTSNARALKAVDCILARAVIRARLADTIVDVGGTRSAAPSSNTLALETVYLILARAVIGARLASTFVDVGGTSSAAPSSDAAANPRVAIRGCAHTVATISIFTRT